MVIGNTTYTDRGEAGAALLNACSNIKDATPEKIGSYRGFAITVSFNTLNKTFQCDLKGAMTHSVELSNDSFGSITRINNSLEKIPDRLRASEVQLETTLSQMESAKNELGKPFALEAEFNEKTARLVELDALLSMDANPETDGKEQGTEGQEHNNDKQEGQEAADVPLSGFANLRDEKSEGVVAKSKATLADYVKMAADRNKPSAADKGAASTKDTTTPDQQHRKKPRDTAR